MKFLIYAFLFVAVASLVIGLLVGLAIKIVGFIVMALLIAAAGLWIMSKVRSFKSSRRQEELELRQEIVVQPDRVR